MSIGIPMVTAAGCILIPDDEKLANKLKNYITDQLCGDCDDEWEPAVDEPRRAISFYAPRVDSNLKYYEENYTALYKLAGTDCIEGNVTFSGGGVEHWCHHYDPDTRQWTEYKGRIVYAGLPDPDVQKFLQEQGEVILTVRSRKGRKKNEKK